MTKDLKSKAVKIQGKDYVLVSDRVLFFNETYPKGCISTKIIEQTEKSITIRATVYPEGEGRKFTGHSHEIDDGKNFINKTSLIENAETSAVGRALGFMGIGVIDSITSADELVKAKNHTPSRGTPTSKGQLEFYLPFSESGIRNKVKDAGGTFNSKNKTWILSDTLASRELLKEFRPQKVLNATGEVVDLFADKTPVIEEEAPAPTEQPKDPLPF